MHRCIEKIKDEIENSAWRIKMGKIAELSEQNKVVIVDFWADWCGPCRTMNDMLESLKNEFSSVVIKRVNVDEQWELAADADIKSLPTLMLLKNGEIENTIVGLMPRAKIEEIIKAITKE